MQSRTVLDNIYNRFNRRRETEYRQIFIKFRQTSADWEECLASLPTDKPALQEVLSAQGQMKDTILHIAVRVKGADFVEKLVALYKANDVSLDIQNYDGNTPLLETFAIFKGCNRNADNRQNIPQIALVLLENGADIRAVNGEKKNILHVMDESIINLGGGLLCNEQNKGAIKEIFVRALANGVDTDARCEASSYYEHENRDDSAQQLPFDNGRIFNRLGQLFTAAQQEHQEHEKTIKKIVTPFLLGITSSDGAVVFPDVGVVPILFSYLLTTERKEEPPVSQVGLHAHGVLSRRSGSRTTGQGGGN